LIFFAFQELASMYDGAEEAKEDQVIGLLSSALAGEPISDHLQSMTLYLTPHTHTTL
jgi:hypothetical protein